MPLDVRATRKATFARTLNRAVLEADISQEAAARALGLSRQRLARFIDPDDQTTMQASDLPALPSGVAWRVMTWLAAEFDWGLSRLPKVGGTHEDDLRMHAALIARLTAAIQAHAEHLADGVITAQEAAEGLQRIEEAVSELLTLRVIYQDALAARALPVRLPKGLVACGGLAPTRRRRMG